MDLGTTECSRFYSLRTMRLFSRSHHGPHSGKYSWQKLEFVPQPHTQATWCPAVLIMSLMSCSLCEAMECSTVPKTNFPLGTSQISRGVAHMTGSISKYLWTMRDTRPSQKHISIWSVELESSTFGGDANGSWLTLINKDVCCIVPTHLLFPISL